MLSAGHQPENLYTDMWRALERSGKWFGEVWNRHKDGSFYTVWLSLKHFHDDAGKLAGYIGTYHQFNKYQDNSWDAFLHTSYDSLTGVANEHLLLERMEQAMHVCDRDRLSGAILYINLDNFTRINELYGYRAGDIFLIQTTKRLCDSVRDTDTVARIGGDEFIILLSVVQDRLSVELITESVLGRISLPCEIDDMELRVTASIGISLFPDMGASAAKVIDLAERAMRKAKQRECNSYHYHPRVLESLLENTTPNDDVDD